MPALIARYGVQKTFYFALESPAATSSDRFVNTAGIFVAGDCLISKDGGATGNTTNLATQVSNQLYGITLTATEMEAQVINVFIIDQNGPVWRDLIIQIETRIDDGQVLSINKAQAGAASTITLAAADSAVDDFYNECTIILIGATGALQQRVITDYTGATKVANINRPWVTNPDATTIYMIRAGADVWDQLEGSQPTNAQITGTSRTMRLFVQALFRRFYNLVTQTGSQQKVFADDSATNLATMAVSTDGTTQTKAKAT